jgi:hypothetical protein
MEVSGQFHALAAVPPRKEPPRHPLDTRLGGLQSRSGRGGKERNHCPCRESNSGRTSRSLVTTLRYYSRYTQFVFFKSFHISP